ncbi:MAG: TPM domain-containing protein [Herpetosiphonaceae bacterium]|nr:TPM domain-containing protein [Herpetosiphonaceae bacterium]
MIKRKEQVVRRAGLLLLVWSLLIVQAVAAAGTVKIDDPDNLLGSRRSDVDHAAQQLAAKGADVVVMVVRNDGGNPAVPSSDLPYINQRLATTGIGGATNNLPGNTILFYRSPESQLTGIYYVPAYKSKLDPAVGSIFNNTMRPLFTSNNLAGGLVAGIDAVRTTLYPPTSPFTYGVIGIVVLSALALLIGPQLSKRRVAATALADARSQVQTARNAAGAAIADLGQLLRTAQEKAQYDKLSYGPADLERITEFQSRGEQVFVEAQSSFDQAELDQNNADAQPTVATYQHVAQEYEHSRALTEQAAAAIQEAERLRATLDQANPQPSPATGTTQRL